MQQRALIEPRVPVLYVTPYLPLCCRSLIGAYSSMQTKKAQEEDGGIRKTCMEAVCLNAATSSTTDYDKFLPSLSPLHHSPSHH